MNELGRGFENVVLDLTTLAGESELKRLLVEFQKPGWKGNKGQTVLLSKLEEIWNKRGQK